MQRHCLQRDRVDRTGIGHNGVSPGEFLGRSRNELTRCNRIPKIAFKNHDAATGMPQLVSQPRDGRTLLPNANCNCGIRRGGDPTTDRATNPFADFGHKNTHDTIPYFS